MVIRYVQRNQKRRAHNVVASIALFLLLSACGIKGDPVPPVEPVNWGDSMQKKDKPEEKKNENP